MKTRTEETIIIGAGLSGLLIAKALNALGKSCLILEKSKGVGGRIATRRMDNSALDHGALFLDTLPEFEDFLKTFHAQYLEGGMNQFPKKLSADLDILKNHKVEKIFQADSLWEMITEDGQRFRSKNIIVTAPLPQACLLLESNHLLPVNSPLKNIHYQKALVHLAVMKEIGPLQKSFEQEGHSFYLMRERKLHPHGVIVHYSKNFIEENFESEDEMILLKMRSILNKTHLGDIQQDDLKKWRYSRPLFLHPEPFVEITNGLFLTGDGFSGAFHSTNKLVQVLRSLA